MVGVDPGEHQDELSDMQAVRIGYRGGHVALDPAEPVCVASTSESPRFFSSMTVTSFSVLFTGIDIAATRPL